MRIQLSSGITLGDIDLGQVTSTSNLNIVRSLYKVSTKDSAIWNEAGSVSVLQAPRNFNTLGFTDDGVWAGVRRCEQAKVIHRVDCVGQAIKSGRTKGCEIPGIVSMIRSLLYAF